jgi:hypothetical protein
VKDRYIGEPSASYQVDYIINVKPETKIGTDIPLYNQFLVFEQVVPWVRCASIGDTGKSPDISIRQGRTTGFFTKQSTTVGCAAWK